MRLLARCHCLPLGAQQLAHLGADARRPALALLPAADASAAPDLDAALAEFAYAEQEDCACTIPAWPVEEEER